jgi:hypothetical protein
MLLLLRCIEKLSNLQAMRVRMGQGRLKQQQEQQQQQQLQVAVVLVQMVLPDLLVAAGALHLAVRVVLLLVLLVVL